MVSRFRTIQDEPDEIDAGLPAHKVAEVERRFESRGAGALSIADFETRERSTIVELEQRDGKALRLALTYDPVFLSEAATQTTQDLSEDGDPLGSAEMFCRLVLDWQLVGPLVTSVLARDDNDRIKRDERGRPVWERVEVVPPGEPVPLDPEIVQYLPTAFTLAVWREIGRELNGDPKPNRHARRASRRR